jgi:ABC-2 type transport system ATP-binding protein
MAETPAPTPPGPPAHASGDPVIAVRGLTKRYGGLTAVDSASFEVHRGEVFGILGPNGAGKTTLVEMIEGLTVPTSGSATVLGHDVLTETVRVKERIGVQLQASSYHRYLTLREILELFGSFYPRAADPDRLLERVGLADRARSRVGRLSGGLQQRFSIVAALVNEPELAFFDEPTAGLDPDARRGLWRLIEDVRALGSTVVLTTHYMEEAERLCDRVAILDHGRIVAIDTPEALVRRLDAPFRVRITTAAPLATAARAERIDGASSCLARETPDGHVLELRATDAPAAAAALLDLARDAGVRVLDLVIQPLTLEDVFLELTGSALADTANGHNGRSADGTPS